MLKKLLKYEYMATAKTFYGIYIAILGMAFFMGVSLRYSDKGGFLSSWSTAMSDIGIFSTNIALQMAVISFFCYFALVIAMFVVLIVSICQRFYKNLLGNEGYLMNTLPVTPAMLIVSKLLVALFWEVLSVLVLFVSLGLFALIVSVGYSFDYSMVREVLRYLNWNVDVAMALPLFVGSFLGTLLSIYLAMLIGHNFKKGVIFISIIAYFVINNVHSWLVVMIAWVIQSTSLAYIANALPDLANTFLAFLLQLAFAALYFFCAEYLLRKHLNLE